MPVISSLFDVTGLDDAFVLFSAPHLITLFLIVLGCWLVHRFRTQLKRPRANRAFRLSLAGLLILCEIALESWHLYMGVWTLERSLPLQLCSISLILSVIMLLTNSYRVFEFVYLPGLGGALQALLTPDLGHYSYPHFRTFEFFLAHGAIVIACAFMICVEGYRPYLVSIWRSLAALNVLALLMWGINSLTGGNYMFISAKPENASLLDYLGPWPWYLLALEAAALIMCLVLYAPFAVKDYLQKRKNCKIKEQDHFDREGDPR